MKKLLVLFMAVMMLTLSFTACSGKKDETSDKPQTETTEKGNETTEETPDETETTEPDQSYEQENTEMSEFESLVDTFNNSEDEAEKEAARLELEKILEQAEKQAQ